MEKTISHDNCITFGYHTTIVITMVILIEVEVE